MSKCILILGLFVTMMNGVMGQEAQEAKPIWWIDVRTSKEFESGHVEDAINIPHDIIGQKITDITTNKDAEIHLYCRSGRRSGLAKRVLEKMGYTKVTNDGGYEDLKERNRSGEIITEKRGE
ncbi:MAG: hypothetical protein MRJ65_04870 [Candidatus Brocadiaceae bacterium]|nr:hypothetical protein [Candidatus Brocadiaceae bacterium]